MEARWAHNPKAVGSNPTPATNFLPPNSSKLRLTNWLREYGYPDRVFEVHPLFSELSLAELEQVGKFIFEKAAERGELILLEGVTTKRAKLDVSH